MDNKGCSLKKKKEDTGLIGLPFSPLKPGKPGSPCFPGSPGKPFGPWLPGDPFCPSVPAENRYVVIKIVYKSGFRASLMLLYM